MGAKDHLYTARWYNTKIAALAKDEEMKELLQEQYAVLTEGISGKTQEPERPNKDEKESASEGFTMPDIRVVKGCKVKIRGQYQTPSAKPKGAVVHYTAGAENELSHEDAIGTLKYLAKEGLGCPVLDHDGVFYVAENQADVMKGWAHHAGVSSWKGQSSLSRLLIGIEIVGAGKLIKFEDQYYAYYDMKNGKPIPGRKPRENFRISQKDANIQAGVYDAFTEAQEKALINFLKWQKSINPEFSFDWVVGHDEIAPTRKSDPGGSLSMTMPALRKLLKGEV